MHEYGATAEMTAKELADALFKAFDECEHEYVYREEENDYKTVIDGRFDLLKIAENVLATFRP